MYINGLSKQQRVIELLEKEPKLDTNEIIKRLDCSERTARYGREEYNKRKRTHKEYTIDEKENSAIASSKDFKSLKKDKSIVLEEFLELCQVNLTVWKVDRYMLNAWDSMPDQNEYTNYQIKVWLKRKGDDISNEEIKQAFIDSLNEHSPTYKEVKLKSPISKTSKNAAEISIHDLHFGSLCWSPETDQNYDIKIAKKIFLDAVENLASIIRIYNPKEIVFPIGSDFFNVNSKLNSTVSGTPQDEDCRWQKTFVYGAKMAIEAIDYLKEISNVSAFIIPGNHDEERSFYLGEYLQAWYRRCNEVSIDNSPKTRKYWQWGECLVGFSHGSDEIKGTLPLIMANEVPEYWAKTKFREWHTGHLHSKRTKSYDYGLENQGVRERIMPSLAATDSWHKKKGYNGLRSAEAFIWDKEKGNKARFSYQI